MTTTQPAPSPSPAAAPAAPPPPELRSAHAPWASPVSAWVMSSVLGALVLLATATDGGGAYEWWFHDAALEPSWIFSSLVLLLVGASAGTAVALAWRRPNVALLLLLVPTAAALVTLPSYGWWLALVAVAALQTLRGTWVAVLPWLGALGVTVWFCLAEPTFTTPVGPITLDPTSAPYLVVWLVLLGLVLAGALGARAVMRARRRVAAAARATARAAERTMLAAERSQVARDLHDVVAHHVSLVAVRAESARYTRHDLDDETRATLDAIADDARRALTELRSALMVLDRSIADGDAPTEVPRAPQPGAADVVALLAAARAAGQDVDVAPDDAGLPTLLGQVPPAPGYVLARCVQESLTNARRHAPGASVRMSLDLEPAGTDVPDGPPRLVLEISNSVAASAQVTPGRGLVGLHERVALVGGTSSAAVVGSSFVVRAEIPLGPGPQAVGTD